MRCHSVSNVSFGRAYTSKEKKSLKKAVAEAKQELNVKNTSMIAFDFAIPTPVGKNVGIGTSFSDSALNFLAFSRDVLGVNTLQVGPQGTISQNDTSPYAGTSFAIGEHLIDYLKLTDERYGSLINKSDIINLDSYSDRFHVRYDTILGKDSSWNAKQEDIGYNNYIIDKAFKNFKKLPSDHSLKVEFAEFKDKNAEWLDNYALYSLLRKANDDKPFAMWSSELDKNLCVKGYSPKEVEIRRNRLKIHNKDFLECKKFAQFIAAKQQQEAKKNINDLGMSIYGDCLIAFSDAEVWANRDCFPDGVYLGVPIEETIKDENGIEKKVETIGKWGDPGMPALDFSKLGSSENPGIAGQLFMKKIEKYFERYDGVRVDAAWQLVNPFTYKIENGKNVKTEKQYELGARMINMIRKVAVDVKGEVPADKIQLELLGAGTETAVKMTKNKLKHIHLTQYAQPGWGRPNYYTENTAELYQNYEDDAFNIGVGTHDDMSLIELARTKKNEQIDLLRKDLNKPDIETEEEFRNAKIAELFTVPNQFFTYTDAFGMEERINTPQTKYHQNWHIRVPDQFERFYYKQQARGYGINLPESLKIALEAKGSKNKELLDKLARASAILKAQGPYTTQGADEQLGDTNYIESDSPLTPEEIIARSKNYNVEQVRSVRPYLY